MPWKASQVEMTAALLIKDSTTIVFLRNFKINFFQKKDEQPHLESVW